MKLNYVFFEGAICKMSFLREQFKKIYFNWLLIGIGVGLGGCWLLWVLIRIGADSSELRFQFWFIQTYWISVLIHPNLCDFSFDLSDSCEILVLVHLKWYFSSDSSKLWFQFWFIWSWEILVLIHPNLQNFSFGSSGLTSLLIKITAYWNGGWLKLRPIRTTTDWNYGWIELQLIGVNVFSLCITNYHINRFIKHRLLKGCAA